ncbi:MAG: hypothetical protein ACREND_14810 [Gemmatimonadaceae bacterium]
MSALRWSVIVLAAVCARPGLLRAQHAMVQASEPSATAIDTGVTAFVARARSATARYRDLRRAVADGYRPIGGDFPGMGQHWIQITTLFADRFRVQDPPVLEYATIGGQATLVGVAYALPLLAGEDAPAFPVPHAWHEHTRTVAEETDLFTQVMASHGSMGDARLAMLHAWIWLPNPEGMFRSDNWALPFVRAGLVAPISDPGPDAGRVVSLVSGGDAFYERVFQSVAGATANASDSAVIHGAMDTARHAAADWVTRHHDGAPTGESLNQLRGIWTELWQRMDSALSAGVRDRLRSLEAK